MHEAPYWYPGRKRQMVRTAFLSVVVATGSVAAGIAAGVATATEVHGASHHALSKATQSGPGPIAVGFGVGLLVFVATQIGYVLLQRRLNPDKTYRNRYEIGMTAPEYLGRLWFIMAAMAALCCLGLLLQYELG
ncbi:MAG TPA: hypothetical protein VH021_18825 [Trebonia sp.]|nr:hypothetical protein [Trebonia sp.]